MNWKKIFAIIWTGQLFSLLSSTIVSFAIILWLSIETGSAEVLALAAVFALLPQSVLGLFSGVFIDRWNRKIIMIVADLFIASCTLILATFFIMPISVLFPLMTLNHFSGNAYQMSFVEVAWGVGMLLGGLLLSMQKLKTRNVVLLNLMYLVLGGAFLFSGMLPPTGFTGFMALTFIGGISGAIYFSLFTVILQTQIDQGLLGRVFSVYMSLAIFPSMLGLLGTGSVADGIGVTNAFIFGGGVIALIGVLSFMTPAVMKLERKEI